MVLGIIFCFGVIAGALQAHIEDGGGPISLALWGIFAIVAAVMTALAYGIYAVTKRQIAGGNNLTKREKKVRLIMAILIGAGALIGVALSIAAESTSTGSAFSNDPISRPLAIGLAFLIGVILPIIYWFWHKNIDEQEASAYRDGAIAGIYAYSIGLPVWWILWRGGIAPVPDALTVYLATMLVWCAGWFWKKYR
jgi:hypothetical protein